MKIRKTPLKKGQKNLATFFYLHRSDYIYVIWIKRQTKFHFKHFSQLSWYVIKAVPMQWERKHTYLSHTFEHLCPTYTMCFIMLHATDTPLSVAPLAKTARTPAQAPSPIAHCLLPIAHCHLPPLCAASLCRISEQSKYTAPKKKK